MNKSCPETYMFGETLLTCDCTHSVPGEGHEAPIPMRVTKVVWGDGFAEERRAGDNYFIADLPRPDGLHDLRRPSVAKIEKAAKKHMEAREEYLRLLLADDEISKAFHRLEDACKEYDAAQDEETTKRIAGIKEWTERLPLASVHCAAAGREMVAVLKGLIE